MQLSSQEEYGLRCLLQVARANGPGPVCISQIAQGERISEDYAAKLMRVLRQQGLVESTRGKSGGYKLTRPREEITVWDAVTALGEPLFSENFCSNYKAHDSDCVHTTDCSMRALWRHIGGSVKDTMQRLTLADLLGGEKQVAETLGTPLTKPRNVVQLGRRDSDSDTTANAQGEQ